MSIDAAQVGQIAHLARLAISDHESEDHARNLTDILAFVDRLAAIDSQGVEPMAHPLDMTQRLRADEVSEHNERERFQALAPSVSDGCYLVPRVIE